MHARCMQMEDAMCFLIIFHSPLYSVQSRIYKRHISKVSHSIIPLNKDKLD